MSETRAQLLTDPAEPKGGKKPGKKAQNQGVKLLLAIGLLVVAGLVFAYSQGLIFARPESADYTPPTAQEKAEYEQQQKRTEDAVKAGGVKPIGG